LLSHLT